MFYQFVRILSTFWLKLYFKKIEVQGREHIPKDKPLLLACNHPSAFIEPILIADTLGRPLHFMTRGDMFNKSWLNPILRGTHQIPIFRAIDGMEGLRQNKANMDYAHEVLKKNGALIVFVEGSTQEIKKLRPLQKGLARMSRQLYDEGIDHAILPVGINYIDPVEWRTRAMLNFGPVIDPKEVFEAEPDDRKSYKVLTKKVYNAMKHLILHVTDPTRKAVHDKLAYLHEGLVDEGYAPIFDYKNTTYAQLKPLSNALDGMTEEEVDALDTDLDKLNVDGSIRRKLVGRKASILHVLLVVLLLPFTLLGLVAYAPSVCLGIWLKRNKIKLREFQGPIKFGVSMGGGLILYVLTIVIGVLMWGWKGLLILPILLISGRSVAYSVDIYRAVSKKYHLSDDAKRRLVSIFTHLRKN